MCTSRQWCIQEKCQEAASRGWWPATASSVYTWASLHGCRSSWLIRAGEAAGGRSCWSGSAEIQLSRVCFGSVRSVFGSLSLGNRQNALIYILIDLQYLPGHSARFSIHLFPHFHWGCCTSWKVWARSCWGPCVPFLCRSAPFMSCQLELQYQLRSLFVFPCKQRKKNSYLSA